MTEVMLVRDLAELSVVRRLYGNSLENIKIYTLFPPQYLELIREGIQTNIFSEHISEVESYDIYHRAFKDMSRITDSFPKTKYGPSVNLARYFKVFYWQYLTEAYVLDIALKRILDSRSDIKFTYLKRLYQAPRSHAELHNGGLISAQILDSLNRQFPSVVQPLQDKNILYLMQCLRQRLLNLVRPAVRFLMSGINGVFPNKVSVNHHTNLSDYTEARSIALGSSYDGLITITDAFRIAAEKGIKPLWMTEGIDKNTTRSGLVYKSEHDKIERFSINNYIKLHPIQPLTRKERRHADELFSYMMEQLNRIDLVKRHRLTKVMSELRQTFRVALWRTKVIDRVLAHFRGSTIILSYLNGLDDRIIEQLAKLHEIETCVRPHGWMSNFEGFEFIADSYYCDGNLRAGLVEKLFGYGKRIVVSPDPNLMNVSKEWLGMKTTEKKAIIVKKRAEHSIEAPHVILLMTTAARFRCALNEFNYTALSECWRAILDYLKNHSDLHIIVKSHKLNFDNWVAEWAMERGVYNLTILGGRLEDAIITSDLVVDFGKPGTATLSALLYEQPLLLYRGLYKYVREFGDLVHAEGASFAIDTPRQLIREWENFRRNGNAYLRKVKAQNQRLRDLLAKT